MPTYDYVCLKCEREFEFSQSMKADPIDHCIYDDCDGTVKRRIGIGAGIIFKGSGFYETDYKRKKGPKDSKDSKDGSGSKEKSGASESKGEGKTDSSSKDSKPGKTGGKSGSSSKPTKD